VRINDFPLRKIGPSKRKEHFLSLNNQNLKTYLSEISLAEGVEFTHVWLLDYRTSSAEGIIDGRLKLMGLFHNKETSFVVFCSKLVFLNTDSLAPEHYSVPHTSTVCKVFGRLKTELLIVRC